MTALVSIGKDANRAGPLWCLTTAGPFIAKGRDTRGTLHGDRVGLGIV
jgi:hypothetical protein